MRIDHKNITNDMMQICVIKEYQQYDDDTTNIFHLSMSNYILSICCIF